MPNFPVYDGSRRRLGKRQVRPEGIAFWDQFRSMPLLARDVLRAPEGRNFGVNALFFATVAQRDVGSRIPGGPCV